MDFMDEENTSSQLLPMALQLKLSSTSTWLDHQDTAEKPLEYWLSYKQFFKDFTVCRK